MTANLVIPTCGQQKQNDDTGNNLDQSNTLNNNSQNKSENQNQKNSQHQSQQNQKGDQDEDQNEKEKKEKNEKEKDGGKDDLTRDLLRLMGRFHVMLYNTRVYWSVLISIITNWLLARTLMLEELYRCHNCVATLSPIPSLVDRMYVVYTSIFLALILWWVLSYKQYRKVFDAMTGVENWRLTPLESDGVVLANLFLAVFSIFWFLIVPFFAFNFVYPMLQICSGVSRVFFAPWLFSLMLTGATGFFVFYVVFDSWTKPYSLVWVFLLFFYSVSHISSKFENKKNEKKIILFYSLSLFLFNNNPKKFFKTNRNTVR